MKLSIIIPAFNEENRIVATIRSIKTFLSKRQFDFEIIVVDDGSVDRTCENTAKEFEEIKKSCSLLHNDRNRGKGYSVKRGMLQATGHYLLFTDADLSTPIEEVEKLIQNLDAGHDIAIGSRALKNSQVEIHQNILRELMGKIFNRLARLLTFKHIYDSQCGFKCFKREAARKIFFLQKIDGFAFDAEIIYLSQKLGLKIAEVPVIWRNSPATRVKIFTDPIKMFFDLLRIRIIHFRIE